ncbi:MAG: dihydrolipoyl dehydrogenase [bacterium]
MKDLIVIGAGPAGYMAAIRAAQLDAEVLVIDAAERPGGVCLNWGCIPTKTLLNMAEKYRGAMEAENYGINFSEPRVDWEEMITHSRKVVRKLAGGIRGLFKQNGIKYVNEEARLVGPNTVETDEGSSYQAENILLAHGAQPRSFPKIEPNQNRIMTSRQALSLREKPESLVIIGGGAIGVEFGDFYNTFGTEVTILEMEEQILPPEDEEIAAQLEKDLQESGLDIRTSTPVKEVEQVDNYVQVKTENDEKLKAEAALVALGVAPDNKKILADDVEVSRDERGWIVVDENYQTSLEGVYAAGDCIGPPWLAHAASHEGINAVERIFSAPAEQVNFSSVPACTYTHPQVASVGLTEADALDEYQQVKVGKFPFQALGRTIATDETEGFVKLVFAGDYRQLVGAHILGAQASELISGLVLGKNLEVTPDEIIGTIFAHPTRAEAIHEAALSSYERTIHS